MDTVEMLAKDGNSATRSNTPKTNHDKRGLSLFNLRQNTLGYYLIGVDCRQYGWEAVANPIHRFIYNIPRYRVKQ